MTWVSFVKSTARISTIGLSSTKSYRRRVPIMKAATILPRLRAFASPVTTPFSTRSTTASVNISVWMPEVALGGQERRRVAAGIAPIPSCRVAPSGTRSAMYAADLALDVARSPGRGTSGSGTSTSTARSMW